MESLYDLTGEKLSGMGIAQGDGVIQILESKDGGFSIVHLSTAGVACILAIGKNWEHWGFVEKGPEL